MGRHIGNLFVTKMRLKPQSGFTLIEVLIYIGLFSLIIGGLLLTTYTMIQGSGRLESNVVIGEEGTFVIRKLYWALAGASGIVPSVSHLEVTNLNFPEAERPFVFTLDSGNIMFGRGSGALVQLNSEDVEITALVFTKITGSGSMPDAVRAQFTISHLSQSKDFDATKYLRQ